MLRTAFGAIDALVNGSTAGRNIVRNTISKKPWITRAPAQTTTIPWHQRSWMSRLGASRSTATQAGSRTGRLRSPFAPKRPFHFSRSRRAEVPPNGKAAGEESLSLSARLKKLSREYGWTAVGVYLALSVLDFPFCFLLVRTVGTEKIAHLEHIVVSNAQKFIPERVQERWREYRQSLREARRERTGETGELEIIGHGVAEAEERSKQDGASLATQLALAYAIHKSFIFIRVPLTAAVTPKVVKVLRSWGWQIGKRKGKR
ncbi:N-terminal acetyltransferase 2 [Madurella mycetomatis]|uniref:N-terminal acetyltransferase 2 n=1 Tax=Madurella mycetomatis TaxID=100816 RepID=A0A175WGQ2_9PEZI|nr:N-terminal acetyltransferase 2 [Madurella mycetomatis]